LSCHEAKLTFDYIIIFICDGVLMKV